MKDNLLLSFNNFGRVLSLVLCSVVGHYGEETIDAKKTVTW